MDYHPSAACQTNFHFNIQLWLGSSPHGPTSPAVFYSILYAWPLRFFIAQSLPNIMFPTCLCSFNSTKLNLLQTKFCDRNRSSFAFGWLLLLYILPSVRFYLPNFALNCEFLVPMNSVNPLCASNMEKPHSSITVLVKFVRRGVCYNWLTKTGPRP